MKNTSFTRQATHQQCARRFYFRYMIDTDPLAPAWILDRAREMRSVYSLREAAGAVAHNEIRDAIRRTQEGETTLGDELKKSNRGQQQLLQMVQDKRIAEAINGLSIDADTASYGELVDGWVHNGLSYYSSLHHHHWDKVEVEIRDTLATARGKLVVRLDLLLRKGNTFVLVDWKIKSVPTKKDNTQMKFYLEFVRSRHRASFANIQGMLVSLLNGYSYKVLLDPFDKIAFAGNPPDETNEDPPEVGAVAPAGTVLERYPAHAGLHCMECAFWGLCKETDPSAQGRKGPATSGYIGIQVR